MTDFRQFAARHVMLSPMRDFLLLLDQKVDNFLFAIYKQDDSTFKMLQTLNHFGFFHILVPLNEFMIHFLSSEHLRWWNQNILLLENYNQMRSIQNQFHAKATANASEYEIPYPWSFDATFAGMESLLWESYPKDLDSFLQERNESIPGKLIPGLFSRQLSEIYIKLLNDYALPRLNKMNLQYDDYVTIPSKYELAATKLAVHLYSGELGFQYVSLLSNSVNKILAFREKELADMHYYEYKRVLLDSDRQTTIASFLTVNWIQQLQNLAHYAKKLLPNEHANSSLRYALPVLMQCVGLNDDASLFLWEILQQMNVRDSSSEILLLALYRAVSVERYNHRSKIVLAMENIFDSKNIPNNLIDVFDDILKFYKALSNELPKRFQKETLKELIDSASEQDKCFYYLYSAYPEYSVNTNLESIKWVYDCIFFDGQLVSQLEAHLEQIKNFSVIYSRRILHVYCFYRIFHSLASHLDSLVRVAVRPCLEYLNIDVKLYPINANEVFKLYSHRQYMQLVELDKRLKLEMEHIPDYHTVLLFEKINLDRPDTSSQLLRRIENELLIHQAKINQLETARLCTEEIRNYILKYTSSKDTVLNKMIMEVLISNPELTQEFCESVYEICENTDATQMPLESLELLKKVGALLEQAISYPEKYQNKLLKDDFLTALDNILACLPGINTASSAVKAIISLKKAFENLENRICSE